MDSIDMNSDLIGSDSESHDFDNNSLDLHSDLDEHDTESLASDPDIRDSEVESTDRSSTAAPLEDESIASQTHQYEPLDLAGRTFRLLRLSRRGRHLNCDLFQASFDDRENVIPYEALSYAWGGMEKDASIILDGRPIHITWNLYWALSHLVNHNPNEDRILWIDAICIDQSNNKERGHQVRQMGVIYRHAYRVLFWLGIGDINTSYLFRVLKSFQNETLKTVCTDWITEDPRWLELWSRVLHPIMHNVCLMGLGHMLNQEWFRRVWILQEVGEARAAIVCSGKDTVLARVFALAPILLRSKPDLHLQAVLDIMPGPSRENSWWGQRRNLYNLLRKFHNSEASVPQDRIFALLGLAQDVQNADTGIVPDYDKPTAEIIEDLTRFLFLDLDIRPWIIAWPKTLESYLTVLPSLNKAAHWRARICGNVEASQLFKQREEFDDQIAATVGYSNADATMFDTAAIIQAAIQNDNEDMVRLLWNYANFRQRSPYSTKMSRMIDYVTIPYALEKGNIEILNKILDIHTIIEARFDLYTMIEELLKWLPQRVDIKKMGYLLRQSMELKHKADGTFRTRVTILLYQLGQEVDGELDIKFNRSKKPFLTWELHCSFIGTSWKNENNRQAGDINKISSFQIRLFDNFGAAANTSWDEYSKWTDHNGNAVVSEGLHRWLGRHNGNAVVSEGLHRWLERHQLLASTSGILQDIEPSALPTWLPDRGLSPGWITQSKEILQKEDNRYSSGL